MIINYEIGNFKAFSGIQSLRLAPITLIYGPNSSGKSSIIQSLMMIQQTLLDKTANGKLVTSGDSINLGEFESLVYGQNEKLAMHFSITYKNTFDANEFKFNHSYDMPFSNNDVRKIELSYNLLENKPTLNKYRFSCNRKIGKSVDFELERSSRLLNGLSFKLSNSDSFESLKTAVSKNYSFKSDDKITWNRFYKDIESPFKIGFSYNLPICITDSFSELSQYSHKIVDDIKYVFDGFKYLGPLRSSPKKIYSDAINNYQKGQGKSNLGKEIYNSSEEIQELINEFLHQFEIPYDLTVKNIGNKNTGQVISILLKDLRNKAIVTPKDVGFGIGQVLPIILDAVVSRNRLICVEQPEIHLHPKLQAHLGDLFISSVLSGDNQWVIETHSEALMLRLQRRIRDGLLDKNLVSVLYVDVGKNGAQVTELELDDEGDFLTYWPNGFFEERLDEVLGV